jgi:arginyl-tRNA synthetase
LRKQPILNDAPIGDDLLPSERELLISMEQFPSVIQQSGLELNPSLIAIYVYNLAKRFSSFYAEHSIANAESEEKRQLRLRISVTCANIIRSGLGMLGIDVPERM